MLFPVSFLIGLLFGAGLLVSGMSNPAKVLGFMDLAGQWDPSLALVMAGAIGIAMPGFMLAKKREQAILGGTLQLPTNTVIDRRLLIGSGLFGIGWGLAGICPAPVLTLPGAGALLKGGVFLIAMLAGMLLLDLLERSKKAA